MDKLLKLCYPHCEVFLPLAAMEHITQASRIGVIGGGSWATALVKILSENDNHLSWYVRKSQTVDYIKREFHNPNYLSSVELHLDNILLTSDITEACAAADILIFAIPSAFLHAELQKLQVDIRDKIIFSAIKGIVPETGLIVGEYFNNHYKVNFTNIGVITGPCHAEEVALEKLSYLTIACADTKKAEFLSERLINHYIKTKISDDIIGTEYAAVLKNIYAIAAGIAHGLGYGDNFQSVLMSNAIREMKRFIDKRYKMKRNINNSAYLGDLLVTGYSTFSRNRMFGNMLGKGYTVKSAMMEMQMVAEGYYAAKSAHLLIDKTSKKSKTPIINAVYAVLYEGKSPKKVFGKLTEKLN